MQTLASVLVLLSLLMLIIGLIKPVFVIRWGTKRGRLQVLLVYGLLTVIFAGLGSYFYENSPERIEQQKIISLSEEEILKGNYSEALKKAQEAEAILQNSYAEDLLEKCSLLIKSDKSFNSGLNLIKERKIEEAYTAFSNVVEQDKKNYKKAQTELNKVKSELVTLYTNQALKLTKKVELIKSKEILDKAVTIDNNNSDILTIRGSVNLASSLSFSLKEWVELVAEANNNAENPATYPAMIDKIKNFKETHNKANELLKKMENSVDIAIDDYSKAIQNKNAINGAQEALNSAKQVKEFTLKGQEYHQSAIDYFDKLEDVVNAAQEIEEIEGSDTDTNNILHGLIDKYENSLDNDLSQFASERENEHWYGRWFGIINDEDQQAIADQRNSNEFKVNTLDNIVDLFTDSNEEKIVELSKEIEESGTEADELAIKVNGLKGDMFNLIDIALQNVEQQKVMDNLYKKYNIE